MEKLSATRRLQCQRVSTWVASTPWQCVQIAAVSCCLQRLSDSCATEAVSGASATNICLVGTRVCQFGRREPLAARFVPAMGPDRAAGVIPCSAAVVLSPDECDSGYKGMNAREARWQIRTVCRAWNRSFRRLRPPRDDGLKSSSAWAWRRSFLFARLGGVSRLMTQSLPPTRRPLPVSMEASATSRGPR